MSTEFVKSWALKYFDNVGIAGADNPLSIDKYENWLVKGFHGEMSYLNRHLAMKAKPQELLANSKSWIVVTQNYDTKEPLYSEIAPRLKLEKKGWIARYVRGGDYHQVISEKLNKLVEKLKEEFPGDEFLACVDTKAVLERDTAYRAGLGWIGKNTCLLDQQRGSFFFIAEILTTLELTPDMPVMDHCGTCTRCIDACPTGAIEEPKILNATKCISYWTIESKTSAPESLSRKFGQNIFGCDICQDVCPWNQKARRTLKLPEARSSGEVDLKKFLKLDHEQIKEFSSHTAMGRAKPDHLLGNVKVALKNSKF
jgi:epoxyqueuosine reductase